MPWSSSSTTVLRSRLGLLLLAGLLGWSALPAAALNLEASVERKDADALLTIHLIDFPRDEVLKALSDGFRTEIVYTIQVLRRGPGFLGIPSEELLQERILKVSARWDQFENEYQISLADGGQVSVSSPGLLFGLYTQMVGFALDLPAAPSGLPPNQIKIRAEVWPIKLVSPLTLMTFFSSEYRLQSKWKTLVLPGEGQ